MKFSGVRAIHRHQQTIEASLNTNAIDRKGDFPARDLKQFVAYVKANASTLNQGHAGVGSIFFTCCPLLNSILEIKPTTVPFNGGAPAINAMVDGQVDIMCVDILTGASQIEFGRIKSYAVGSIVRKVARDFDRYWNSESAYPAARKRIRAEAQ
jgi:tripartite-type tricarboxylate transporter receptor subunit TctC